MKCCGGMIRVKWGMLLSCDEMMRRYPGTPMMVQSKCRPSRDVMSRRSGLGTR